MAGNPNHDSRGKFSGGSSSPILELKSMEARDRGESVRDTVKKALNASKENPDPEWMKDKPWIKHGMSARKYFMLKEAGMLKKL